jgi:hypothetical protein
LRVQLPARPDVARLLEAGGELPISELAAQAAPVHPRRVRDLFVERHSDDEFPRLAGAPEKLAVDCGSGEP